jgi:two-component system, response regulator RegA
MLRVFLLDDDDNNRLTLSVLLEEDGFFVRVASSLSEARAVLASEATGFDIFLLDHSLGDGFGTDLVPEIRTRFPASKVVSISGSLGHEAAVAATDLAVAKAIHFPTLAARLRKLAED